jgi:hypothetical protein
MQVMSVLVLNACTVHTVMGLPPTGVQWHPMVVQVQRAWLGHGMCIWVVCACCTACRTVCVLPCACDVWWLWLGTQGSTQGSGPAQGPVWGCDCVICRRHGGSECVCGAWHGMWVVWMLHSMCAAMCMQCVVDVVGHTGQHAGFWACIGPCVGPCVGL